MPREPQPWYWKARKAWYVQIDGKQIRLHEDKKKAQQECHRLLGCRGRLDERQRADMRVDEACELLIDQSQHLRPGTLHQYKHKLGRLAHSPFGRMKLTDVQPEAVVRWIGGLKWKQYRGSDTANGSRHMMLRYVKTLYKWARDTGLIQINPFVRTPNRWTVPARSRPMSDDEYRKIMTSPRASRELLEIVEFVWRTGARPGELAILAARHLDPSEKRAVLQPDEHKTGSKTGQERHVYFPDDLWDRLLGYAAIRPDGPLLHRHGGKPWSAKIISMRFTILKKRHGIQCVLYQARHRFLSDLVEGGAPLGRVAKLAGHNGVETLMKSYYHPDSEAMAQDVASRNDAHARTMADIAADVAARREEQKERKRTRGREFMRKKRAELKQRRDASPDA